MLVLLLARFLSLCCQVGFPLEFFALFVVQSLFLMCICRHNCLFASLLPTLRIAFSLQQAAILLLQAQVFSFDLGQLRFDPVEILCGRTSSCCVSRISYFELAFQGRFVCLILPGCNQIRLIFLRVTHLSLSSRKAAKSKISQKLPSTSLTFAFFCCSMSIRELLRILLYSSTVVPDAASR